MQQKQFSAIKLSIKHFQCKYIRIECINLRRLEMLRFASSPGSSFGLARVGLRLSYRHWL